MKRRELRRHVQQLTEAYELRFVQKTKRYLGLHKGVFLDVQEWDGDVVFKISSPSVYLSDDAIDDFSGFEECRSEGISSDLLKPLYEHDANGKEIRSHNGIAVCIDEHSIDQIGPDVFLDIPDIVASDLEGFGAAESIPCTECGQQQATNVRLLNYTYAPFCDQCWKIFEFQTTGGKIKVDYEIRWFFVIPAIALLTLLGGWLWGYVQQPERLDNFGLFAIVLPAIWAFGLSHLIAWIANGVSPFTRVLIFMSVVASVLFGNIWGWRSFLVAQAREEAGQVVIPPTAIEAATMYFSALPQIWSNEIPFMIGGIIGAWIGLKHLKSSEVIEVS